MLKDFTKEEFDIIIQAGQSNCEGSGFGDVERPYEPNQDIWYMEPDFTISVAKERVRENRIQSNFGFTFSEEYIKSGMLANGRKLLILRTAVGGTGFSDKRWGPQDDLFLTMLEMIKTAIALNSKNRIVAFLWHQGETDAIAKMPEDTYYDNLSNLFGIYQNTFNTKNIPIVLGDFVSQWKANGKYAWEPIIAATKRLVSDNENFAFVETDGLESNDQIFNDGDDIHFCRKALYLLGIRYFEEYKKCLDKLN